MFDLATLIRTFGYVGLFVVVFAESGLFLGFFLPGDSLLFTAGFLASQGFGNIWILCALTFAAAVLGDSFGYAFGKRTGPRLFRHEHSLLFHPEHLMRAQAFYEAHGGKTIFLARFTPVARTFAPIVAGAGRMPYSKFLSYNVFGGLVWAVGISVLGYTLGSAIPDIDHYLIPIILLIIAVSLAPAVIHILRERKK